MTRPLPRLAGRIVLCAALIGSAAALIHLAASGAVAQIETERASQLLELRQTDLAEDHIGKALRAFPGHPEATWILGGILYNRGDKEGTEQAYLHAAKHSAYPARALRLVGDLFAVYPEQRDEGLRMFELSLTLSPPVPDDSPEIWWSRFAQASARAGNLSAEVWSLRKAQESGLAPADQAPLNQALARAYLKLGLNGASSAARDRPIAQPQ